MNTSTLFKMQNRDLPPPRLWFDHYKLATRNLKHYTKVCSSPGYLKHILPHILAQHFNIN